MMVTAMGVAFDSLFEVSVSPQDVLLLPEELLALPGRLDQLFERLGQIWGSAIRNPAGATGRERWDIQLHPATLGPIAAARLKDEDCPLQVEIVGPCGFTGIVMQHAVSINHHTPWRWFLNDVQASRSRLMQSCRWF